MLIGWLAMSGEFFLTVARCGSIVLHSVMCGWTFLLSCAMLVAALAAPYVLQLDFFSRRRIWIEVNWLASSFPSSCLRGKGLVTSVDSFILVALVVGFKRLCFFYSSGGYSVTFVQLILILFPFILALVLCFYFLVILFHGLDVATLVVRLRFSWRTFLFVASLLIQICLSLFF